MKLPKTFSTIGDIGDSIVFLPCLKSVGNGILYCVDKLGSRIFTDRIPLIKRLFESQPYVEAVLPWEGQEIDYDAATFRLAGMPFGVSLGQMHADYVKLEVDLVNPWLKVPASKKSKGRIVVSRSPRYRNKRFPWGQLVKEFQKDMLFVGLKEEYREFCQSFGHVEYAQTKDMYDVATLIQGSELFIGNQSSPNAICEGLKHPSVLEVCLSAPDCIYSRTNATFCVDGSMNVMILGKRFETPVSKIDFNLSITPPGGWQIELNGKPYSSYAYSLLVDKIRTAFSLSRNDAIDRFLDMVKIPVPTDIKRVLELI